MASKQVAAALGGKVKPVLSLDKGEARRRVLNLYRAWYRQAPYILHDRDFPITVKQMQSKVRELILANKDINDIRVIDMMVIRGQMELNDTVNKYKSQCHVLAYFNESVNPPPKDFLSKFLAGKSSE